jgi:hypothetical protein
MKILTPFRKDKFLIPTPYGLKNAKIVAYAEELLALKDKSIIEEANGIWIVIRRIIDIWKETHPKQWQSYLIELDSVRRTRLDSKFGLSKNSKMYHGDRGNLRYTLDIPEQVYMMIRAVYNDEELPMDKEFFNLFARKFPMFKVSEKN